MNNKFEHVLKPIKIGPMELKNRITFSPTYPFFSSYDNHINRELIEWIRPIAAGGVSCVSIGTGAINKKMPAGACHLVWMGDDSVINQLSQLFDTVHAYNCKAGIELVPLGEFQPFDERDKQGKPQIEVDPNKMTKEEIKETIEEYGLAAERVLKAGGDMIVLHGAHGQPPAAFFSKAMNGRHDEYGCDSFENRARFTVEVLESIRSRVGNKLAIEYRISGDDLIPNSPTLDELIRFVQLIEDKIDLLHVSKGLLAVHKLTPYVFPPLYFERGYNIENASKFKKALHIPVSAVGSITVEMAEEAIASGKIDMVAISRGLIADPEIINKVKKGQEDTIRPCVRCNNCINRTHNFFLPIRCAVNPTHGREMLFMNYPIPKSSKRVAVIGGGPAGMEAARTAASRGHQVTLFEQSAHLGGTLNMAASAPFKADIKKYIEWSVRETVKNENIKIRLATKATPELIKSEGYDTVIVAIGSEPIIPDFAKCGSNKVVWVGDVESGHAQVGEKVIIAGAGMTGLEAALNLARQGKKVTVIDMLKDSQIGAGGTKINMIALRHLLDEEAVKIITETRLDGLTENGIIVTNADGKKSEMECDTLVLSLGVRTRKELAAQFEGSAQDVYIIGDCATNQGTLFNAVKTAYDTAMAIL